MRNGEVQCQRQTLTRADVKGSSKRQQAGTYALFLVAIVLVLLLTTESIMRLDALGVPKCTNPYVRREWRSLTSEERLEFIRAVNLLAEVPSEWRENGTIYDDFAILHGSIGSWGMRKLNADIQLRADSHLAHRSASFLPWHRYTLIIYEEALRKHAGFTGYIPYVLQSYGELQHGIQDANEF